MDIVVCTDHRYVMPTGVMMYSVCVNNLDMDVVFHIIADDSLTDEDRHDLEDILRPFDGKTAIFYAINKDMFNCHFPEGLYNLSMVTYYRLFIPEILSTAIDKVLYLDGDVIVRHSLRSLWNTDIGNDAVRVVYDAFEDSSVFNRLGYASELGYFNAGVMLINLKYWRDHTVTKDFMSYMRDHSKDIKWHDQDVLNFVFSEKKSFMPLKYNLQHGFLWKQPNFDLRQYKKEFDEACKDPVIVHFTGEKPWNVYQRKPHPFRSTFYKYQNQTKWKDVKYDNRNQRPRIINQVLDLLRKLKAKIRKKDYIKICPIDE